MLKQIVDDTAQPAGATEVAVAFYDWETTTAWSLRGERWFHAASTIKVPILLALVDAIAAGKFEWESWVHVRNRLPPRVAVAPSRIPRERDADSLVHGEVGKLMRVRDLAERMIVASSNLATNLLLDLLRPTETRASAQRPARPARAWA